MFAAIEEEVLVNLIREDEKIVTRGRIVDPLQFLTAKHFARWIRGRVDDDCPGACCDRTLQVSGGECPLRRAQRHVSRLNSQSCQRVYVIAIIWLEDKDLISRVEERLAGGVECTGRARCDNYLALRVTDDRVVVAHLARNGGAQRSDSVKASVGILSAFDGLNCALANRQWHLGIADALSQINALHLFTLDGHRADIRLND